MCLLINSKQQAQIVEKDIVCYKVVYGDKNKNVFKTAYKRAKVKINCGYESRLEVISVGITSMINIGIHSFSNKKDAIKIALENCYAEYTGDDYIFVIQCTIPINSKYYRGFFECYPSYASNCIKYNEIIWEKQTEN